MSGGVDSSVAALLLKEQGYEVIGAHMVCWEGCELKEERRDAMRVAAKLGIPFFTFDFRKEYRLRVFEYMIREYAQGRTPNPDVMCNKYIKFGLFLTKALERGADYIATGHYVRIQDSKIKNQNERPKFKIFEARDKSKDQSYFLWTLTQEQLRHCLFPMGGYLKSEVREIARRAGLPTAEKKDSQGLCFVGKVDFGEFLRSLLPNVPGAIVSPTGKVVGGHDGAHFYTIGQRHGLELGGFPSPLYVAEKRPRTNTLVVTEEGENSPLYRKGCLVQEVNWISPDRAVFPLSCQARIRYRQPLEEAHIMKPETDKGRFTIHNSDFLIRFVKAQRAVASGQSMVFYQSHEMLGGGIITDRTGLPGEPRLGDETP